MHHQVAVENVDQLRSTRCSAPLDEGQAADDARSRNLLRQTFTSSTILHTTYIIQQEHRLNHSTACRAPAVTDRSNWLNICRVSRLG